MPGKARRILVVQHEEHMPPGLLAEWALDRDVHLDVVRPAEDALPDARTFDGMVLLGLEMTRGAPGRPSVEDELGWIAEHASDVPILGVGSGSCLLATVLGGRFRRCRPWIGYGSAWVAADGPVPTGPWLLWEEHAITPPSGSRLLARNARGALAFGHGHHIGVQFHPEATPWMVDRWSEAGVGRALQPGARGLLRTTARRQSEESERAGRALFDAFLQQAVRGTSGPRPDRSAPRR